MNLFTREVNNKLKDIDKTPAQKVQCEYMAKAFYQQVAALVGEMGRNEATYILVNQRFLTLMDKLDHTSKSFEHNFTVIISSYKVILHMLGITA